MSVVRIQKRENPFVQIDKRVLNDDRISWKAKGILAYLLSKPHDWITYITDIEKRAKDGRDSVRAGIKELIEIGYIQRIRTRDENGKFKGWEYVVYEQPIDGKTEIGKSEFGKSEIGKSNTTNNEVTNNDLTNNEYTTTLVDVFNFYQQNIGVLSPFTSENLEMWCNDLSPDIVLEAMKRAVQMNKRNARYIEGILKRWTNQGLKTIDDIHAAENEFQRMKENQPTKPKQEDSESAIAGFWSE